MSVQSLRVAARDTRQPILHELEPLNVAGHSVAVSLTLRQSEDGVWRGRLEFHDATVCCQRATAEIFCASSESELWQSALAMGTHHLRDLYRSLV